jgi:hypothetical protein
MSQEKEIKALPGALMFLVLLAPIAFSCWGLASLMAQEGKPDASPMPGLGFFLLGIVISVLIMPGFFVNQPNMGRALLLFGNYIGTVKHDGWFWTNPFYTKTPVSLRAMTLNGDRLKVNDSVGNPVEIACIVVWQVNDTFRALFEVDNYMQYVALQTETALRHSASTHPYDADEGMVSLVRNTDEVGDHLMGEIQDRLDRAGIKVLEARLSHLAYAPEIAGVMLRKQQAAAVIAARQRIVDGAVGMVEMALQKLDEHNVVQLDDERKAAMVSNLMVVLCSESAAQPVLNAGTLYP